jgi:hypothetical protein
MKLFLLNKNVFEKIFKSVNKRDKKVLGRWNLEYCNKKLNTKIDLSNEDHCGPCGQYILDKMNYSNDRNN